MNNPEFVRIDNEKYKINTDFRVAIKCNDISLDKNINNYEKTLAIIFLLFGDKGINDDEHYEQLLELGCKYLNCGKESKIEDETEIDMDFIQDQKLIESSFQYDYGYNPYKKTYMHWWDFYNDMCNLSNSELGNCCVLNRVRNLRTFDVSTIKDSKTIEKIIKAKEQVALKREIVKSPEERRLDKLFEQQLKGR